MRLSAASFSAQATLSPADQQTFKRYSYALLQLPAKSGHFLLDSGRRPAQHTIINKSGHVDIQIIDPADCQLTLTFMGQLKGKKEASNTFTAVFNMFTALLPGASGRDDHLAQIGEPVEIDLAAVARRRYWPRVEFGKGSALTGVTVNVQQFQYLPTTDAVEHVVGKQQQQQQHDTEEQASVTGTHDEIQSRICEDACSHPGSSTSTDTAGATDVSSSQPSAGKPPQLPSEAAISASSSHSAETSAGLKVGSDRELLRQQLRGLLEQLQQDCGKLAQDQAAASALTSVADAPQSPESIQKTAGSRNEMSKKQDQEHLKICQHTQVLQRLQQLVSTATADLKQLQASSSSLTGQAAAGTADEVSQPTANQQQGCSALHAAVLQLCDVLCSTQVAQLAADLKTLYAEVGCGSLNSRCLQCILALTIAEVK